MITARNILENARTALKDEKQNEYTDKELLMYMSSSIDYISNILAAERSLYTRKAVCVTASPVPLPEDFLTADGIDENITVYHDYITAKILPAEIRYFHKYQIPAQLDAEMYIPAEFIPGITQYIIARALLRNEYSITAEQNIDNAFMASILNVAKRRGGVVKSAERKEKYNI